MTARAAAGMAYQFMGRVNTLYRSTDRSVVDAIVAVDRHLHPTAAARTAEQSAMWDLLGEEFDRLGFAPRDGQSSAQLMDAEPRERVCDLLTIMTASLGSVATLEAGLPVAHRQLDAIAQAQSRTGDHTSQLAFARAHLSAWVSVGGGA